MAVALFFPGIGLLGAACALFWRCLPWILAFGFIAWVGRSLQLGRARSWPKAAYIAFEVLVELLRLVIAAAMIGLGNPLTGVRRVADFIARRGRDEALARLASGWTHHWPEVLAAAILFAILGLLANVLTFIIAAQGPVRRLARRAGIAGDDDKRATTAIVLFIKNLTVIPFSVAWIWELLLFLTR